MGSEPIDQINRFVIMLSALLVAFAALVLVVLAWGAASGSIDQIEDFASWLRDHNHGEAKLILTLAAVVVALTMLTLVIVELTPPSARRMRVRNVGSGEATLTTKQIAERIDGAVAGIEHVAACEATVVARGRRVDVSLELYVDAGADLAQTADAACFRAQTLVEGEMGIELTQPPRARLHYRELRLGEGGAAAGAGSATSAPTGWERPRHIEEARDQRGNADAPEEAQAQADRAAGPGAARTDP